MKMFFYWKDLWNEWRSIAHGFYLSCKDKRFLIDIMILIAHNTSRNTGLKRVQICLSIVSMVGDGFLETPCFNMILRGCTFFSVIDITLSMFLTQRACVMGIKGNESA